jgi:hypothetical protein
MNSLRDRVLSYLENHQRVTLEALLLGFSHEDTTAILEAINELHEQGWAKYNKSYTEDGYKVSKFVIYRSKKKFYVQPKLF